MTGLVNSVINLPTQPPAGAVVQVVLFQDDTERRIADLERRLVESEGAYDQLAEQFEALQSANRRLQAEVGIWRDRADAYHRVALRIPIYGCCRR